MGSVAFYIGSLKKGGAERVLDVYKRQGVNGLLVPIMDEKAMTDGILRLIRCV